MSLCGSKKADFSAQKLKTVRVRPDSVLRRLFSSNNSSHEANRLTANCDQGIEDFSTFPLCFAAAQFRAAFLSLSKTFPSEAF